MILRTNSEVRSWRDCPRKHLYQYKQGWRPRRVAHSLRYGSAWHELLEEVKAGRDPDFPALQAKWDLELLDTIQLSALLVGYLEHWGPFDPAHEPERGFECPLLHPDTWEEHPEVRLAGKIDGLQPINRLHSSGTWELWEHKTSSEISESYWQKLQLDSQLLQYVVGAESLGRQIERIVYDVVRKPSMKPLEATPVEKRRKKKDGTYYKGVRLEDEHLDAYAIRLALDIDERPDHYFERRELARDESQVRQHLLNLWAWTDLIGSGPAPQNPDACTRFGLCPFWDCCSTGSEPADHPSLYHRLEDVHPELA